MDRDRNENTIDPVERVSPSTGGDDTGTTGAESAQKHRDREERGTEAAPESRSEPEPVAPLSDEPPIADRDDLPGTARPSGRPG